jgi:hypothetical protein
MPKLNLTRRWKKARPGSVLILVIALLVLLALIGTAYLSSTQTERYSSVQNSINTEADLLIQGLQTAVSTQITSGLYGGSTYRPPQGEMPTYAKAGTAVSPTYSGYANYVSATPDPNLPITVTPPNMFLADRIPSTNGAPVWNNFSWPLFTDPSGNYTFDSPFEDSTTMYLPINKASVVAFPGSKTINGVQYPALTLEIVTGAGRKFYLPNTTTADTTDKYLTPSGPSSLTSYKFVAASASGDGIADAGLFKLPVGQIDGITYYGAIRVVDGNSAINISSANSQGVDTNPGTYISSSNSVPMASTNFGFFRSNIGLSELLPNTDSIAFLNGSGGSTSSAAASRFAAYGTPSSYAVTNAPNNFAWYSYGDEIENMLTRSPGNTVMGLTSTPSYWNWLGQSATSILAYKYSLINPNAQNNWSAMERSLPNSLLNFNLSQSTPWSPAQYQTWYANNFQGLNNYAATGNNIGAPLRTVLVGNNAVSNGVPAWYGNAGATAPVAWTPGANYQFGDWVVDGPSGAQRSYVCIQAHNNAVSGTGTLSATGIPSGGNEPNPPPYTSTTVLNTSPNPGAIPYWAGAQSTLSSTTNARAPGMPWTTLPVKTSVNTATFAQLWLGFCQVMCDSVSINNIPALDTFSSTVAPSTATPVAQWQPPMLPVANTNNHEQQMGQFRSVIRDSRKDGAGRLVLTSAQMLKLRAALAAVNTIDLRDGDDDVTSRDITLADDGGNPQYDVEVYGTEIQPYISEVIVQTDGKVGDNYVAIEICNPYPKQIQLTQTGGNGAWQIGSMSRSTLSTLGEMTLGGGVAFPAGTIVPAAANGMPGILIIENAVANRPSDVQTCITNAQTAYPTSVAVVEIATLDQIAFGATYQPNEVFIMRTRRADCKQSTGTGSDSYNETLPSTNLADYVPVDQIDLTDLALPAVTANPGPAKRYYYRRANDQTTNKTWHCVYPSFYDPTTGNTSGRYFTSTAGGATSIVSVVIDPTNMPTNACFLGLPKGGTLASSTYNTLPIELNNTYMASPNQISVVGTNMYPFGAFARNLDMLKIPFIGAYRIRPYSNKVSGVSQFVTELNSVSMDSALAFDNSATPNQQLTSAVAPDADNSTLQTAFNEQIGRFCPIGNPSPTASLADQMDFGTGYATPTATSGPRVYWHYHWARKLFDYFTVQAPSDDYYPNADPAQQSTSTTPPVLAKYPGGVAPVPVANTNPAYANAQVAGHSDDTTGVEGLININTAPVAVLAQLPFFGVATSGGTQTFLNAQLAQSIVNYRNANGPFQSIWDLYKVTGPPSFEDANNGLLPGGAYNMTATPGPAGPSQGVFSPGGFPAAGNTPTPAPTAAVRYDFQDRFLLLNNISNLITTRSDTFTCYVLLQGWRNVGTGNASLAVQRRVAFLVDRNAVTPGNNQPASTRVPSE